MTGGNLELRWRFPNPLTLASLKINLPLDGVDCEGGEETMQIGACVLNRVKLRVNLGRVALVTVGTADPFIGG